MNANGSQSAYTVLIADDNSDTVEMLSALVRTRRLEARSGPSTGTS